MPFCAALLSLSYGCSSDPDEPGKEPDKPDVPVYDEPAEKAGMTLRGYVIADGTPLAGVAVSDGVDVTLTGNDGAYYLASAKANGYVFMSVPSGYEAPVEGNTPKFWSKTSGAADRNEVVNFTLKRKDQSKVALLTFADFHLAKRNNDINQFGSYCNDANNMASQLKAEGYAVYGVSLGDESWDKYWYDNNYSFSSAYKEIERLKMPFFHNMGNHDNDPYRADDRKAEKSFREKAGPTFYSFNAGTAHVIVLDNIKYKNAGASIGTIGNRKYDVAFVDDILAWLKKDLATVADKSKPLVLCMHAQFYKTARSVGASHTMRPDNGQALTELLAPFSNVTLLTGHVHENCNTRLSGGNGWEHNVGAVCGTWWWTGHLGGSHLCKDGSPGGYGIFKVEGSAAPQWFYKGSGHDISYQFRTFDMNTVYIDPSSKEYSNKKEMLGKYANGHDSKPAQNNLVLVNVFNYSPDWKISVSEDGKELSVTQVAATDPLHTLSYNCKRVAQGATPTEDFVTSTTAHMFKVTATSPTSTLTVKVTDSYGNVYTEQMQRPKAFTLNMK